MICRFFCMCVLVFGTAVARAGDLELVSYGYVVQTAKWGRLFQINAYLINNGTTPVCVGTKGLGRVYNGSDIGFMISFANDEEGHWLRIPDSNLGRVTLAPGERVMLDLGERQPVTDLKLLPQTMSYIVLDDVGKIEKIWSGTLKAKINAHHPN